MTRSELAEWARRKIDEARTDTPSLVEDEGRALLVWGTIGSCGYVTVDGDVYLDEDTLVPEPGTFARRRDESARRQVLLFASRQYPELAACLPVRSGEDLTCPSCPGTGWISAGANRIVCQACGGLGWVPAA